MAATIAASRYQLIPEFIRWAQATVRYRVAKRAMGTSTALSALQQQGRHLCDIVVVVRHNGQNRFVTRLQRTEVSGLPPNLVDKAP